MPTSTPSNSPLTKPYPSDPATRYRQSRVGQRNEGTGQAGVWTVTLDATGGLWFFTIRDFQNHIIKQDPTTAQTTVSPVANAATMQAVVDSQIGAGNIVVTGGPGAAGGGTPYVFTGAGEMARERFIVQGLSTFLSGGGATQTLTETTVGGRPGATVPIGPAKSTTHNFPKNSPRINEGETLT